MPAADNLNQVQEGLNTLLNQIQNAVDTLLWASQLPLIGDNLQGAIAPFEEIITNLDNALNALGDNPSTTAIQQALFSVLGPDGVGWLEDLNGNGVGLDDIQVTEPTEMSDVIGFDFRLGSAPIEIADVPLESNIGLPGLGFSTEGSAQTTLDLTFDVGFGVDEDGFFMDSAQQDELTLDLTTTIPGLSAQASTLGLLNFLVSDDAETPTQFQGTFAVDLVDGEGDEDEQLTLDELTAIAPTDLVEASLSGTAAINLALEANFGTSMLPSINTDLNIDWGFNTAALTAGQTLLGDAPTISFNNASLDLGSLFDNFISPIFEKIQSVTGTFPLKQLADVLQKRVPILDDLGRDVFDTIGALDGGPDGQVTILDLVDLLSNSPPALDYISAVATVINLVNSIPTTTMDIPIDLGGFSLGAFDARDGNASLSEADVIGGLDTLNGLGDVIDQLGTLLEGVSEGSSEQEELQSAQFFFSNESEGFANLVESGALSFPLLTNPTEAFGLLLGQPVDLIVFDVPQLGFGFGLDFPIPIVGPLSAIIRGEVGAAIDFTLGLDTSGLSQGGLANVFEGFYISPDADAEQAEIATLESAVKAYAALDFSVLSVGVGGGIFSEMNVVLGDNDGKVYIVTEFSPCLFDLAGELSVGLSAFIEFDFGIFKFRKEKTFAEATLLSFNFDTPCSSPLDDPNTLDFGLATVINEGTGILRLNMGSNAGSRGNGIGTSDTSESFGVRFAEVDGVITNTIEVGAFGVVNQYENITEIVANGGEEADAIAISDEVNLTATLSGGNGNDQIYSGSGNDHLEGNAGNDFLDGGEGNNTLLGGAGDDVLISGNGADILDGGADQDRVTYKDSTAGVQFAPDTDNPSQYVGTGGTAEGDRLISMEYIEGSEFSDVLLGNGESNTLEGLGGDDHLEGHGADDFLIGGAGADLLDGGAGRNATSYIPSEAAIYINLHTGAASGGDATGDQLINIQDVQGSNFGDVLTGNDQDNRLGGFWGDDTLQGRGGEDILDGGHGIDWAVYTLSPDPVNVSLLGSGDTPEIGTGSGGHAEGDTLIRTENVRGSGLDDQLTGDRHANVLDGSGGDDDMYANQGNDTLIGGWGADFMDGGADIDLADYSNATGGVIVDLLGVGIGNEAEGDTFETIAADRSTVERLQGSYDADQLFGDANNNEINPGWSNGSVDFVDGRTGSDRLVIDRSDDGYARLVGGFASGTDAIDVNFLSRQPDGSHTILEQVAFTAMEHLSIIATMGDDEIYGGGGNDQILTGDGNDIVYGGRGNNIIFAGAGDDFVVDQNDGDRQLAGTLPDHLISLDGGSGIDTLSIDLSGQRDENGNPINIVLESTDPSQENPNQRFTLSDGTVAITGFEVFKDIRTGEGSDRITQLGRVDNIIQTQSGDDQITPGLGIDIIDGGFNNDGGETGGNDHLILDYSSLDEDTGAGIFADVSEFGAFNGHYTRRDGDTNEIRDDVQFTNIERLTVTGTAHADVMVGILGADQLHGNEGNDSIYGAGGGDQINGGTGLDLLIGGRGDDFLSGGDDADVLIDEADDFMGNLYSGSGNDTLEGGQGDDWLLGGTGTDQLFGQDGNDLVIGGDGDDFLDGGAGNDTLIGINFGAVPFPAPAEIDTMTGGTGADQFWLGDGLFVYYNDGQTFTVGAGQAAHMTDFDPTQGDTIQLHGAAGDYELAVVNGSTHIRLRRASLFGQPELIGIVEGVTNLNLNANYFTYVDDAADPGNPDVIVAPSDTLSAVALFDLQPDSLLTLQNSSTGKGIIASPVVDAATQNSLEMIIPGATDAISQVTPSKALVSTGQITADQTMAAQPEFQITPTNAEQTLLQTLLGDTTGLSNFNIKLTGDARAFGTFQQSPVGLESGVVMSTGIAAALANENLEDGGKLKPKTVDLVFEKLNGTAGIDGETAVFRAELSDLGFDIHSLAIADSGLAQGGSPGVLSGLDLDSIKISNQRIEDAAAINALPGLDVFDFSPAGTLLTPGTQRPGSASNPVLPDLFGTLNGVVNNAIATLDQFDYSGSNSLDSQGTVSLGDGGKLGFNLTEALSTDEPLYLYVGEAGNNEAAPAGLITASDRAIGASGQLSTDFGLPGAVNDTISLELEFDADSTADQMYFQFVFGSEEFVEFGGSEFNDRFSLELNGVNMAYLSDGKQASINNLVPISLGNYHPDFIHNPVGTGPASGELALDGYTQVLTFAGSIQPNTRNTLKITVKDVQDGLLDSAIFIQAGSLGTSPDPIGKVIATPVQGDRLQISESGDTDTLQVQLNRVPTAPVQVTLQPNPQLNLGNGTGQAVTLDFTPENALLPQFITVAAVNDGVREGDHRGRIRLTTQSTDPIFNSPINTFALTADITDNDGNQIEGTMTSDTLVGTKWNDRITGYGSRDFLTGGIGEDEFVFTSLKDGLDTITDFELGSDRIVFTPLFDSLGIEVDNYVDAVNQGYISFGTTFTGTTLVQVQASEGALPMGMVALPGVSIQALNNFTNFVV